MNKKYIKKVVLTTIIVLIVLMMIMISGCDKGGESMAKFISFGTYGECTVGYLYSEKVSDAIYDELIDGVGFFNNGYVVIDVYKDDIKYSLKDSYDNEWLNKDDLLDIQEKYVRATGGKGFIEFAKINDLSLTVGVYFSDDEKIESETIDGVEFIYSDSIPIRIYNQSNLFISLQKAYDEELLNHDDLLTIKNNYSQHVVE